MSTEADIEGAIYERAHHDGQFAIAYGLLRCALWLKYLGGGDNGDRVGADALGDVGEAVETLKPEPTP